MKDNIIIFSKKFLLVYLLLIMTCIFSINEIYMPLSFNSALLDTTFGRMFPIFIFLILNVSSYKLLSFFNKNYLVFLRYKNKEEYLDNLVKYLFKNLCILFMLSIILLIIFSLFYHILFGYSFNFSLILFIYYIYCTLKMYIIYWLLIKISIYIYKLFSIKISSFFSILILVLKEGYKYSKLSILSFKDIPLFYGYYLFPMEYGNLFLDIFSFILQIIFLSLIGDIIKKIILKYKKIYIED